MKKTYFHVQIISLCIFFHIVLVQGISSGFRKWFDCYIWRGISVQDTNMKNLDSLSQWNLVENGLIALHT